MKRAKWCRIGLRRDNEHVMRQTISKYRRDLQEERALIERLPFSCLSIVYLYDVLSVTCSVDHTHLVCKVQYGDLKFVFDTCTNLQTYLIISMSFPCNYVSHKFTLKLYQQIYANDFHKTKKKS